MMSVPLAGTLPRTPRPVSVHERVDHLVAGSRAGRSASPVGVDDPHQLPVAGRRVLAARALEQPARRRRARPAAAGSPRAARRCRGRAPPSSAGRARRRRARRCRACSSPRRRSRLRREAPPHRRHRARSRTREARGYPTCRGRTLGLIGVAIFIVCVIALAAGITWLVVRLCPLAELEEEAGQAAA